MNCMLQHNYLAMYPTYQKDQELVYASESCYLILLKSLASKLVITSESEKINLQTYPINNPLFVSELKYPSQDHSHAW